MDETVWRAVEIGVEVLIAIVGALVGMVLRSVLGRIASMEKAVNDLKQDLATKVEDLREKQIASEKEIGKETEAKVVALHGRVTTLQTEQLTKQEKFQEQLSELRETVAGFGGIYVTRKETSRFTK